jgi:hypothetical protein
MAYFLILGNMPVRCYGIKKIYTTKASKVSIDTLSEQQMRTDEGTRATVSFARNFNHTPWCT